MQLEQKLPGLDAEIVNIAEIDDNNISSETLYSSKKIDELNSLFVKLQSTITQIIDSDIAMATAKKIFATDTNSTEHILAALIEYSGGAQSEFGDPNDPICLNSAMVDGWSMDGHVKHTYKDLDGTSHDERLAWVSDVVSQIASAVADEALRAQGVESDLADSIAEEATAREDGDTSIQTTVDSIIDQVQLNTEQIGALVGAIIPRGDIAQHTEDIIGHTDLLTTFIDDNFSREPAQGDAVKDLDNVTWVFSDSIWIQWGNDNVNIATLNAAGIVLSSSTDGQVFVEADGKMSLVGWDAISARVSELGINKVDKQTFIGDDGSYSSFFENNNANGVEHYNKNNDILSNRRASSTGIEDVVITQTTGIGIKNIITELGGSIRAFLIKDSATRDPEDGDEIVVKSELDSGLALKQNALSRTVAGNDASAMAITDNGSSLLVPMPVTLQIDPVPDSTQITIGTRPLRIVIITIINNLAYLFANIQEKLPTTSTPNRFLTSSTNSGSTSWGQVGLTTGVTGTLPVANGGTGRATITANRLLFGNNTTAVGILGAGNAGQVLQSNGDNAPGWIDNPNNLKCVPVIIKRNSSNSQDFTVQNSNNVSIPSGATYAFQFNYISTTATDYASSISYNSSNFNQPADTNWLRGMTNGAGLIMGAWTSTSKLALAAKSSMQVGTVTSAFSPYTSWGTGIIAIGTASWT